MGECIAALSNSAVLEANFVWGAEDSTQAIIGTMFEPAYGSNMDHCELNNE